MLVPLTTRTWIDDAPGTMVAWVVVVERGLVVDVVGEVVVGVDWLAVRTLSGARVADGMSRAPMTTPTTTTAPPRRNPDGAPNPEGSRSVPPLKPPPWEPGPAGSSERSLIAGGDAGRRWSRTGPGVGRAGAGAGVGRRVVRARGLHSVSTSSASRR